MHIRESDLISPQPLTERAAESRSQAACSPSAVSQRVPATGYSVIFKRWTGMTASRSTRESWLANRSSNVRGLPSRWWWIFYRLAGPTNRFSTAIRLCQRKTFALAWATPARSFTAKRFTLLRRHETFRRRKLPSSRGGSAPRAWSGLATRRTLLTFDKDFGELAFRRGLPSGCGIILFRLTPQTPDEVADLALAAIGSQPSWAGYFSVITRQKIRMRPLQHGHD